MELLLRRTSLTRMPLRRRSLQRSCQLALGRHRSQRWSSCDRLIVCSKYDPRTRDPATKAFLLRGRSFRSRVVAYLHDAPFLEVTKGNFQMAIKLPTSIRLIQAQAPKEKYRMPRVAGALSLDGADRFEVNPCCEHAHSTREFHGCRHQTRLAEAGWQRKCHQNLVGCRTKYNGGSEVQMAKLRIGTSGWTYDGWRGSFYPPTLAKRKWLSWYAARFRTTEVNGSFYRTPSLVAVAGWREQTPDDFIFSWKASKFITH
jgi:hypothetical protein